MSRCAMCIHYKIVTNSYKVNVFQCILIFIIFVFPHNFISQEGHVPKHASRHCKTKFTTMQNRKKTFSDGFAARIYGDKSQRSFVRREYPVQQRLHTR